MAVFSGQGNMDNRFSHRFQNMAKILPYCNEAKFFDNDNGFALVAEYRNGQLLSMRARRPAWLSVLLEVMEETIS